MPETNSMNNQFRKRIKKVIRSLVGHHSEFSLENRIFNSVSVISLIGLVSGLILDLAIDYPTSGIIITILIVVVQSFLYYLARYRKKFNFSRVIYILFSFLYVCTNYYYNSGINGSSIFVFFLTFTFIIAISPKREYWFWTLLHIVVGVSLFLIQWYYPQFILYSYPDGAVRVFDFTSTFIITLLMMYFITDYIKVNYDFEKSKVKEKTDALELQKLELEKANEEKNKLFSIISHDLRSPLNSIMSYFEALSHGLFNETEKAQAQKELLELTTGTSNMLNDLLSWTKAQMDGVSADIEEVNLAASLSGIISSQKNSAAAKNIELHSAISKDIEVMADANMTQVVVRNLLNNAIKFTRIGGKIELCTDIVNGRCRLSITDNGIGIPEEKQKDIFSLKSRSTYGTNNEKGIGLGLLLCKEFIELQGGTIGFSSAAGAGTTFFITLPVK